MVALPSLRTCFDLFRLRRRLPRMLEREPLDVLLERLEASRPTRTVPVGRARLEASITAAESLVTRFGLAPDTCLYRSMARYALLRGHGIPAIFCMGVPSPDRRAEAGVDVTTGHAWVEDEEGPYREEIEENQFVPTFCHPAASRRLP